MRTFAKHFTQGYVGKIKEVGTTLKISISSSYRQRNQNGDYEDRTYWNTVTVFDDKRMKFIRDHVSEGDLVQAEGMIREDSYEKDGEPVYTTLLVAQDFQLLSTKAQRDAWRAANLDRSLSADQLVPCFHRPSRSFGISSADRIPSGHKPE